MVSRIAIAALSLALVWQHCTGPEPLTVYRNVEVPVEVIVEAEPDTVVRWRERIVYRTVEPERVATATGGGQADVEAFCPEPAAPVQVGEAPQPIVLPPPVLLLRSVRTDPGGLLRRDRVTFVGPTSRGDLLELSYLARPGWSARTSGDSLIVRSPRWQVVEDVGIVGGLLGAGYALCRWVLC
jgi:hypothetical protein